VVKEWVVSSNGCALVAKSSASYVAVFPLAISSTNTLAECWMHLIGLGLLDRGFELSLSLQEDQLTSVARRSHVKDTNYEYSKVDT